MAGARVTGDFAKLARLRKDLEKLARGGFFTDANRRVGQATVDFVQRRFATGTAPDGTAWKPPRSRPGGRPLRDTGRLMNSITMRATSRGFTVGSNLVYAAIHNYGGTIRAKNGRHLRFRVGGARGGRSQGRGGGGSSWVSVEQVVIPKRQFLPTSFNHPALKRGVKNALLQLRRERLGR